MPVLVISLDFELFWGVADSRTIKNYGANIEGEWQAVPAMLALFKQYGMHVTWATVGMLMCKDYKQWCNLRPSIMPTYECKERSTYAVASLVRDFPKLFFARPLVYQILATDGQELASHTYSHFLCSEVGVTTEQFAADMECSRAIFAECGVKPTSMVFPRNQVNGKYLKVASEVGFLAYRGNQDHWVYRGGHVAPYGIVGRLVRGADTYLSLTGNHVSRLPHKKPTENLVNIPASRLLHRSLGHPVFDWIYLERVKKGMLEAARADGVFHLWWHPHNFGVRTEINLKNLEYLLKYYRLLNHEYGMRSLSMKELSVS